MTDVAISVQNLCKCYQIYENPRDRLKHFVMPRIRKIIGKPNKQYCREFWALKDVSFEVKKGETIGIIGLNGSGKSTLLQMIAGTLNPTNGSVEVNGRIAALLELGSGFNPEFTGRENVYMYAAILGLSSKELAQRFSDIEQFADIGDFIDQPVKTYSSGMVVRLAFSVSVNVQPDILIVDEALAVGDAAFQFKCMERLNDLTNSGTTLLFVSHDLNLLKMFCSQVIYLKNGSVHASGSAEDVTNIYIMDLRDSQSSLNESKQQIKKKPSLNNGFAYGTSEGRVVDAQFTTGGRLCQVTKGQALSFWIEVEFFDTVKCPSITVLVESVKKIPIGGQQYLINKNEPINEIHNYRVHCELSANFSANRYFVSVRLEDGLIDQNFYVIDKQAALLSFEVINDNAGGLRGMVDLGIKIQQQESLLCV
ncbi:MAG: ABC transporter ATP-binding protein [Methylotenera sp.]|uniref:ABC transporter ATP-binding protein n=1 Tax=Methylotenera sp. TaxID=2051956 RepID=UPI0027159D5F|nr:ABC transporter ATP-binding protein [Methylotenera sp.]MDO9150180.1 ABC transporter ATP-binding protein [Methylotenera sp.]